MQDHLIIPLEEFPEEGLTIQGELSGDIFGIDSTGAVSTGPLRYRLDARLYDTELLVQGNISAPFCMRCDRCLREFDYTVTIDKLAISFDVRSKISVDITQELREEVLLELPGYPKCEISGLECEINDTFCDFRLDKDPHSGVNSATPSGNSVWDALDNFPGK